MASAYTPTGETYLKSANINSVQYDAKNYLWELPLPDLVSKPLTIDQKTIVIEGDYKPWNPLLGSLVAKGFLSEIRTGGSGIQKIEGIYSTSGMRIIEKVTIEGGMTITPIGLDGLSIGCRGDTKTEKHFSFSAPSQNYVLGHIEMDMDASNGKICSFSCMWTSLLEGNSIVDTKTIFYKPNATYKVSIGVEGSFIDVLGIFWATAGNSLDEKESLGIGQIVYAGTKVTPFKVQQSSDMVIAKQYSIPKHKFLAIPPFRRKIIYADLPRMENGLCDYEMQYNPEIIDRLGHVRVPPSIDRNDLTKAAYLPIVRPVVNVETLVNLQGPTSSFKDLPPPVDDFRYDSVNKNTGKEIGELYVTTIPDPFINKAIYSPETSIICAIVFNGAGTERIGTLEAVAFARIPSDLSDRRKWYWVTSEFFWRSGKKIMGNPLQKQRAPQVLHNPYVMNAAQKNEKFMSIMKEIGVEDAYKLIEIGPGTDVVSASNSMVLGNTEFYGLRKLQYIAPGFQFLAPFKEKEQIDTEIMFRNQLYNVYAEWGVPAIAGRESASHIFPNGWAFENNGHFVGFQDAAFLHLSAVSFQPKQAGSFLNSIQILWHAGEPAGPMDYGIVQILGCSASEVVTPVNDTISKASNFVLQVSNYLKGGDTTNTYKDEEDDFWASENGKIFIILLFTIAIFSVGAYFSFKIYSTAKEAEEKDQREKEPGGSSN